MRKMETIPIFRPRLSPSLRETGVSYNSCMVSQTDRQTDRQTDTQGRLASGQFMQIGNQYR